MADDAFALSPIAARAAPPSEADYEAICTAFMETSRGRWFLGEYARRNRNADTRLVLDVLARLEATVAEQKREPAHLLAERLPAIIEMIAETRRAVLAALPQTDVKRTIEPIQRAATLLRDVAWTLRESGADGRVCDLLDVQAAAIAEGCARVQGERSALLDAPAAVTAAFHSLTREINGLAGSNPPQTKEPEAQAEPPVPIAARDARPDAEMTLNDRAVVETIDLVEIIDADEGAEAARQSEPDARSLKAAPPEIEEPPGAADAANLWEDLEVIDAGPIEEPVSAAPEPTAADASPSDAQPAGEVNPAEPEIEAAERPATASLGRALLDSGVVSRPSGRRADVLAPIRRMSQAEKIAFFS